ncbi:MAG TPA: 23S rRNA (uracil(1939)-C(5))-methyltransferase RlmD [Dehalococcoidia bacterium]|nr:23S rRNA (uracil(1939)-C(5))-methyltransferase RlmD [Dehalococcoidia bacterium]
MSARKQKTPLAQHQRLTLSFEGMAYQGAAYARYEGKMVFAYLAIPGETAVVEVERDYGDYMVGSVVEILSPSPYRVDAPCPYFGLCGGCQWQHISYAYQAELKAEVVAEQLRRIGAFEDPPVSATVAATEPLAYRNHARFSVRKQALGFISRPGAGYRFLEIDRCLIMHPWINETLTKLQGRVSVKHQVAMRYGVYTGQWLIQPDVSSADPSLTSGQKYYEEELLGRRFRISAASFFQTNTRQAERLARIVAQKLQLNAADILLDAYAGVGVFAALLAADVQRVIAVEESAAAAKDASHNLSGLDNVDYYQGKVEDILPDLAVRPTAVILDPPRAGCQERVLEAITSLKPQRVVYVSCDPATLARDLRFLCQRGWRLHDVTPVDMFPQTYHIESVATLYPA